MLSLCCVVPAWGQETFSVRSEQGHTGSGYMLRWADSISAKVRMLDSMQWPQGMRRPSMAVVGRTGGTVLHDSFFREKARFTAFIEEPQAPLLNFTGGYVRYFYGYRSAIDTPFMESGVSQHLMDGMMHVTVAGRIPLTVSYSERQSNSVFFRDYRDIGVVFEASEFQKLQRMKAERYIAGVADGLRNPFAKDVLQFGGAQVRSLDEWLGSREVINHVKEARVALLSGGHPDGAGAGFDTSLGAARQAVIIYEEVKKTRERLEAFRDSLEEAYIGAEKQIAAIRKLASGPMSAEEKLEAVEQLAGQAGMENRRFRRLYNFIGGVRRFGLGRVAPNYSDLTIRNVNVRGINFEYQRGIYFAFSAGAIDYRARDFFVTRNQRKPQFVYLGRIGYGKQEGLHLYLTAFRGKKQLLSSVQNQRTLEIYGLSLEGQVVAGTNHRLIVEAGQSGSPGLVASAGAGEKPGFELGDKKNKAYSVRLYSYFPRSRTRVEGYYRYRGIHYQSFTSYYQNAAANSWLLKADQYVWKRQVRLHLSVSQNNFENDLLPVRYKGQTRFLSAGFQFSKKKWPTLQAGYMPSSQLSSIDGQVYEHFYHMLTASASHHYPLGLARGTSVASFNRFYNDSRDSGFLYHNARNFYFSQHIQFLSYSAHFHISRSVSSDYVLTVFDAGAGAAVRKRNSLAMGVKINQLNAMSLKVGVYGQGRMQIPGLGELSARVEKSYLPDSRGGLIKNELYQIGFTRFFK